MGDYGEKIKELRPDVVVSNSVAFWGKLAALKFGLPYICSTTTFAFVEEPGFKSGALKISESFKNSGGIDEAVDFIEGIVALK